MRLNKTEAVKFFFMASVFLGAYFTPFTEMRLGFASESVFMLQDYARKHVLFCLIPAFFIAGAISVFINKRSIMRYFGPGANKIVSYSVAAVSGSVLAVCSCTVLPIFAGIYAGGAGLGPATAFLYSGPAVNVMAVILTAGVLGFELGAARAAGAVLFSVLLGILMHFIFKKEEMARSEDRFRASDDGNDRPLYKEAVFFFLMVGFLVSANWPARSSGNVKWYISSGLLIMLGYVIPRWYSREEIREWMSSTWGFAKQIFPLLFLGILAAGFLLGRPGHEGLIPSAWISNLVGGNSLGASLFASFAGALMYFATLTEIPILQGLIGAGMGKGPALALLLAGPALSLPNMLVIRSVLGTRKTAVFVVLVIIMAAASGFLYGIL